MKVSVVIPVYNEEATLEEIISRVKTVALPGGLIRELVIVNDGSKYRTAEILSRYSGQEGIVIVHQDNQGKTGAILTGFKNATGDIFLIQDADLEYDPSHYPKLLQPILEGRTQVVYGSRFLGRIDDMKPINRWANDISNWTLKLLHGFKMTDMNTCYKIFTRRVWEGMVITSTHFGFDSEFTIKILYRGYTIQEVPIDYRARPSKAGKKINWATATGMYWQIIKYRFLKRP
jgi:glycosyltransferase involved in cell wall biosynthesis